MLLFIMIYLQCTEVQGGNLWSSSCFLNCSQIRDFIFRLLAGWNIEIHLFQRITRFCSRMIANIWRFMSFSTFKAYNLLNCHNHNKDFFMIHEIERVWDVLGTHILTINYQFLLVFWNVSSFKPNSSAIQLVTVVFELKGLSNDFFSKCH